MHRTLLPAIAVATLFFGCSEGERNGSVQAATTPVSANAQTLEMGCAGCVFSMPGAEGCQLAVKIGDKIHLVSGVEMPGHETGLCDHSRMAAVDGRLDGERFVATAFELKP
jgi:hypothetical protein